MVYAENVQLLTDKTPLNFIIKIPNNVSRIRIYLFFYKVSKGDTMHIDSVSFDEMETYIKDNSKNETIYTNKFNNWIKNQDVSIKNINSHLSIISNKNSSTPGIKLNETLSLKPNTIYDFKINGYKKSSDYEVKPYIINTDTKEKIHTSKKYFLSKNNSNLGLDNTEIEIKFKTLNEIINANFYLLFNSPKIGAEFIINSIEINELNINDGNNMINLKDFIENQDVSLSIDNSILKIISNKNTSTPGIKYKNEIKLAPNSKYEFNIIGEKNSHNFNVVPYLFDTNNKLKIYPNNNYLISVNNKELNTNETCIKIQIKTFDDIIRVKPYILFNFPKIGSEFTLKSISYKELDEEIPKTTLNENKFNEVSNFYNWINNQDVNIDNSNNNIIVVSNKENSTPGIKFKEVLNLEKNEVYEFKIVGNKNSDNFRVLPYIIDSKTKEKFYPSKNNLISSTNKELGTTETEIKLVIKMPNYKPSVKLYLLFSNPNIGAEFCIKSIEFNKLANNDITYSFYRNKSHNNNFVAYTEKKSYYPNDTINIYASVNSKIVNNNVKTVTYSLVDINKKIIMTKESTNLNYQKYPDLGCIYGCNWNISESMKIPNNLKSGMYILCARCNNNVWFIPLVIKNNSNKNKILVLSNVNTWNAYEYWAGYNNDMISAYKWETNFSNNLKYRENDKFKSYKMSFNRPSILISKDVQKFIDNNINSYVTYSHLVYSELWMYKFLDNNSIEYDLINDIDLNNNEGVNENYKLFIIHSHPEYWTENALINLNKMTQDGTNLAYFGGNGFYWKTTYNNNVMEVRKDGSNHDQDNKKGGLWIDLQLPNSYLNGPELFGVWFNKSKFNKITLWPFNKTKNNYLLDNIEDEFGDDSLSSVKDDDGGLSGWEVDDVISTYNKKYENNIIASAKNGADMLYIEEDNYKIFSGSTILWTSGLLVDDNIKKLTLNVINSFSK